MPMSRTVVSARLHDARLLLGYVGEGGSHPRATDDECRQYLHTEGCEG